MLKENNFENRLYLKVPFDCKYVAFENKAKWDNNKKMWYMTRYNTEQQLTKLFYPLYNITIPKYITDIDESELSYTDKFKLGTNWKLDELLEEHKKHQYKPKEYKVSQDVFKRKTI